jgi:membrane protein YqaA with SNARE-associated domain
MITFVLCLAPNHLILTTILVNLEAAGFTPDDVSVLYPDTSTSQDFAHEMHSKMPEGATAGASTGGILGGALGWLVGIGSLAIPGVGPIIAAGPILAVLSGAAIGATVGGIAGGLIGLGIPEVEAKRYAGKLRDERILISVTATNIDRVSSVKKLFGEAGADDIAAVSGTAIYQKDDALRAIRGHAHTRQTSRSEQYGKTV